MKYMGSKSRIAKHILPIMLEYAHKYNITNWVEPFVGGGNIIDKVPPTFTRIGADINPHTIQALISIRDEVHNLPKSNKDFTESDYKTLFKTDNTYKYKSYAGFAFSYGAKWLGGWRRDKTGNRDYIKEAYNNAIKQSPLLQNVKLITTPYNKLTIPPNSIIYNDPPYQNTTPYKTNKFNHNQFFQYCREQAQQGHIVFISEYNAPPDFVCIYQTQINSSLTKNTSAKSAVEKLFISPPKIS